MKYPDVLLNEMRLRNFSPGTIKAYLYYNNVFLAFIRKSPLEINQKDIELYLLHLANKDLEGTTRHLVTAALQFYYCTILKRRFNLVYPKTAKPLPKALSKEKVLRLFEATSNHKHRLILEMIYSAGLRVSELIHLRWEDICFGQNQIHLKLAKGRKDRIVMLSTKIKNTLQSFRKSQGTVFKTNRQKSYSSRTIEAIVKHSATKAKLNTEVTPHSLRHSFATHLLEQGVEITYIRDLLGHTDVRTTMIYTKVAPNVLAGIQSPLDV